MQTFTKIGSGRRKFEAVQAGLSGRFVANLVNGAITCIPINNNE